MTKPEPKMSVAPVQRGDLLGLDELACDAVSIFVWSDVRPLAGAAGFLDWRLSGAVSRALESGLVTGAPGEVMLLPHRGRIKVERVFVFGLGPLSEATAATLGQAAQNAVGVMQRAGVTKPVLLAPQARRRPEVERQFVKAAAETCKDRVKAILVEQSG